VNNFFWRSCLRADLIKIFQSNLTRIYFPLHNDMQVRDRSAGQCSWRLHVSAFVFHARASGFADNVNFNGFHVATSTPSDLLKSNLMPHKLRGFARRASTNLRRLKPVIRASRRVTAYRWFPLGGYRQEKIAYTEGHRSFNLQYTHMFQK